jgi:serine/threonine protein kinase
MAPECHGHGQVSPRTDVYSFGIIVLELLMGLPARKHQPLGWEAALMVVLCLLGQLQPPRRRARGASRSSRIRIRTRIGVAVCNTQQKPLFRCCPDALLLRHRPLSFSCRLSEPYVPPARGRLQARQLVLRPPGIAA